MAYDVVMYLFPSISGMSFARLSRYARPSVLATVVPMPTGIMRLTRFLSLMSSAVRSMDSPPIPRKVGSFLLLQVPTVPGLPSVRITTA